MHQTLSHLRANVFCLRKTMASDLAENCVSSLVSYYSTIIMRIIKHTQVHTHAHIHTRFLSQFDNKKLMCVLCSRNIQVPLINNNNGIDHIKT